VTAMTQNKKIVLIDDDQLNNLINTRIITKFSDYTVTSFTSGREGLKFLASSDPADFPEIIFLDINMPVMDGWEFLEEYQKLPEALVQNCLIIMLTSSIDINDIEKSKLFKNVREFMSKPLTVESLRLVARMRDEKRIDS
jgi:CheY-like chemotaxis protein